MATDTIEFEALPGLTLTFDVFPVGSDTASFSAVSATERTNGKGVYRGTVTAPTAGLYRVHVKVGSDVVGVYTVRLANDGADHRCNDAAEADLAMISGSSAAALALLRSLTGIVSGTVDNTAFTPTATEFESADLATATADLHNGASIVWISGTRLYERCRISDYAVVSGRGHFTVTEMTGAPGNGDRFVVV